MLCRGYRGGSPTTVRPSDPALCGSCPLVTPYYCRLGDLLCFIYVYRYSCLLLSMHVCFVLFPLFDLSFVDFPSVLRYCWLGLLTCKNRLAYNLYCVGGDVKHCTIQVSSAAAVLLCKSVAYYCRDETIHSPLRFQKCGGERPLAHVVPTPLI